MHQLQSQQGLETLQPTASWYQSCKKNKTRREETEKVSFHSGHGSLGASKSLPEAETRKLASCAPLCPSRRKRSPPREGRGITVGLAKGHRTHMLWAGVSVMPETREDIPTQGDDLAQAVSGLYLSRQKCSGPEKACLSMAKQSLKNCMRDNICPLVTSGRPPP